MITLNQIVIFTADLNFNVRWNVAALADEFPKIQFTIFLQVPKKKLNQIIYNQFRNLRHHGWRWIPYQASEILSLFSGKFKSAQMPSIDRPGQTFTLEALKKNPQIDIKTFTNINGSESSEFLKSLSADLGIALSAPILKKELFDIPKFGTINLHKGHLPDYRGMPPAFWELKNNENTVGCTIHKVEAGLDSGNIIIESSVPIDRYSTISGMQIKLHHRGVNMVVEAVRLISEGKAVFKKQPSGGKVNTRPPLALEQSITQKLKNHDSVGTKFKITAKNILFFFYAEIFMPLINRWHGISGTQKIIILLYHRVSDQFKDNVTIGIEQFDQQMAYLADNFVTVSLKEIVEGAIKRNSSKPIIAVSFDDGYLDNFENAAPILLKYQLPCTFFICTEKIRDNKPFDHDLRALGFGLDNMSWDQVIKMKNWGLHFGSHTLNHVNLADTSDGEALHELKGSLNDIRTKLNQDNIFIAYPYGGKQHITPERRQMIKQVGYSACFSAYGGCNDLNIDLFNIKRIAINWAFDMMAFKARLKGWDKTD